MTRAPAAGLAEDATGLKNMQQLIQLRWIAVVGQVLTIAFVHLVLGIALPMQALACVLAGLVAFNAASQLRWRRTGRVTNAALLAALLVDVGTLTALLYLTGGTTNPFVFLYLLQVILGAVLLSPWATWTIVAVAIACFAGLARFSRPLPLPPDLDRGLASFYVIGLLLCFALNAALLVVFITRISRNLRARDARLADLRQRAAEQEHIVRMGLLASGAAHELGTPLATLSVILGDWRRLPALAADAELSQDLAEMQAQLQRCKSIVSGILLSAGETRGESSAPTTVRRFMDALVADWRARRSPADFHYDDAFGPDQPMVSDSALRQTIGNVLDNAFEASPVGLRMRVSHEGGNLVVTVDDSGPGFAPQMLAQLGKPYQSSKGRPGGGLGLFLAVNVARTLGGQVSAHNRAQGGAQVRIALPLAAIRLDPKEHRHEPAQ